MNCFGVICAVADLPSNVKVVPFANVWVGKGRARKTL